jgi:hypothetical protein
VSSLLTEHVIFFHFVRCDRDAVFFFSLKVLQMVLVAGGITELIPGSFQRS